MKKLIAVLLAALMISAALPAFAFTGFDSDPGLPEIGTLDEAPFPVEVIRVENEPTVEQTPWGESYNVWVPVDDEPFNAGDTVTFAVQVEIPYDFSGFDAEALNAIEVRVDFSGLEGAELIEGVGLTGNSYCDYDLGMCLPLPGYENAAMEDGALVLDLVVGDVVEVIVSGAAKDTAVTMPYSVTIGQYRVPARFSVGKLTREDGCYCVTYKDIMAVQIRGMKFLEEEGVFAGYLVSLNDKDYIRSEEKRGVTYTSVDDPADVIASGARFEALERAYNDFMTFFDFEDDGEADVLTDGVFLFGSEPVRFSGEFSIESPEAGEPTEPAEPTEPTEPGEEPTEPIAPQPPVTGAASLAFLGALAVCAGAAVAVIAKKKNN